MTNEELIEMLKTLPPTAWCGVRLWHDDHEILSATYDQGEVRILIDEPDEPDLTFTDEGDSNG